MELQCKVDKLEVEKSELVKQLTSREGQDVSVIQELAESKGMHAFVNNTQVFITFTVT